MLDELIVDMRSLVADRRAHADAGGYFAAMYLGVTEAVRTGLAEGRFSNPTQLEALTVTFARRYLDAARSDAPTASWAAAFDVARRNDVTVIQHLLLGMNAHINLDLGVACAAVAPGDDIHAIRRDFDEINTVLAELVAEVQASLSQVSWLYRFVGDVADSHDDAVINFSIGRARSFAWELALDLAALPAADAAAKIVRHDAVVAGIGRAIASPPWFSRAALRVLRFSERKNVVQVIDLFTT